MMEKEGLGDAQLSDLDDQEDGDTFPGHKN